MSRPLLVRHSAKRHIQEAFRWYECQSPLLGKEFLAAVETSLDRISSNPLMYATIYRDIRRGLLPRFPYGVFYFVRAEQVVVIAVLHTSRDPALWRVHH